MDNGLLELKKRMIASVVSDVKLPGPEITFLRARLLGQRSSRTSGEINAAYTVGSVGYWPVWDERPRLDDVEAAWFSLRGQGLVGSDECLSLARELSVSEADVAELTARVEANLEGIAMQAQFVPVVAMVPEEVHHFLFDGSDAVVARFLGWDLPEFAIREWDTYVHRWEWMTRFGSLVPDVVASIVKESTVITCVGEPVSDSLVADWIAAAGSSVDDLVTFELAVESMSAGDRGSRWGEAESAMLPVFERIVRNVDAMAAVYV